jgi:hypothetical protein
VDEARLAISLYHWPSGEFRAIHEGAISADGRTYLTGHVTPRGGEYVNPDNGAVRVRLSCRAEKPVTALLDLVQVVEADD